MRIVICDDDAAVADRFREKIRMCEPESEISIFTNETDFLNSDFIYDVTFLDIEFGDKNGFDMARDLSEKHPNFVFSFITTHAELAVDGYDYKPVQYILKTAPEPVIDRKISETINEYYRRNRFLKIPQNKGYTILDTNNIIYIEIVDHNIKIVLSDGFVRLNKTLNEMNDEFKKFGLVRCHKSFVVALLNIKSVNKQCITMKNDIDIPIGRQYKKSFFEIYNDYLKWQ